MPAEEQGYFFLQKPTQGIQGNYFSPRNDFELSVHGRAVSQAYGVYIPDKGLNQRGRFIINPQGTIMGVEVLAGPVGRY